MAPGLVAAKPTLTRKALAARIGVTADGIKYHLTKLTENGRIRRVGPTRKGHWEVLEYFGKRGVPIVPESKARRGGIASPIATSRNAALGHLSLIHI